MATLRNTITDLATDFAQQIVAALREMPLEEVLAAADNGKRPAARSSHGSSGGRLAGRTKSAVAGRGGRLERRSPDAIKKVIAQVVGLLRKHKQGLRSEQIQAELGLAKKELQRPIAQALSEKNIRKTGEKRATTYFSR